MTSQNNHFLENAIVSTGSDITDKVEIKEGISKKDRMLLAKDIFCSIINGNSHSYADFFNTNIANSYAIADRLIKEGGL